MNDQVTTEETKRPTLALHVQGEGSSEQQLFASLVQTGVAQFAAQIEEASVIGGGIFSMVTGRGDDRNAQKEAIGSLFTSMSADILAIAVASSSANLGHPVELLDETLDGVITVLRNNARSYRERIEQARQRDAARSEIVNTDEVTGNIGGDAAEANTTAEHAV